MSPIPHISDKEKNLYEKWLNMNNFSRRILRVVICAAIALAMTWIHAYQENQSIFNDFDVLVAIFDFLSLMVISILWTRGARYARALTETLQTLKIKNEELEKLCCLDPLTGLYSRAYIETAALKAFKYAAREKRYIFCVVFDIDRLKNINDTFGHLAGDDLIKSAAKFLQKTFRDHDFIMRRGGDEFEVIGTISNPENFKKSLKEKIAPFKAHILKDTTIATFSYGCAIEEANQSIIMRDEEHDEYTIEYVKKVHEGLFHNADAQMYLMKGRSKNK
jgi:diguanylate cyclase (GGDEF)-like protein